MSALNFGCCGFGNLLVKVLIAWLAFSSARGSFLTSLLFVHADRQYLASSKER